MKTALQITSWFAIVIGVLALIGSEGDTYTIIGALLFFCQGLFALIYIKQTEEK